MNVTTTKSERDPKHHIRQLEMAIEDAKAAAAATIPFCSNALRKNAVSVFTVDVSYPSFEFRETLRTLGFYGQPTATGLSSTLAAIRPSKHARLHALSFSITRTSNLTSASSLVLSPVNSLEIGPEPHSMVRFEGGTS
jgi:hypothetical protein